MVQSIQNRLLCFSHLVFMGYIMASESLTLQPKPALPISGSIVMYEPPSPSPRTIRRQSHPPQQRSLAPATNGKLEKFRQQPLTLEQLKRSQPSISHKRLSNRLYINGIALPALRVGALAVVFRADCQGFQLYSWGLRSPLSSLLFETYEYCCEAAVELVLSGTNSLILRKALSE